MLTTESLMGMVIIIFLMIFMAILYAKVRIFLVILIVYVFSLVIGVDALQDFTIPFSPYLQVLFLLYQSLFFLLTAIKTFSR